MALPAWAFWVALAGMLVGLAGVFLPVIPGVGLIWLVALVYALCERFRTIDPATFAVLTVLGGLGVTSDLWTSHLGARAGGASLGSTLVAIAGGLIGALVGAWLLGVGAVPSALVGALLAVFLMEWQRRREWRHALKAAGGLLLGCAVSTLAQFAISVLMIGIFVWQVLRGAP